MNRFTEKAVAVVSWMATLLLFCSTAVVLCYLVYRGAASFDQSLVFADVSPIDALLGRKRVFGALFPALAGTLLLIISAIASAAPVGIAAGIYLAEYATPRWRTVLSSLFDVLAGLPSIVIGLAGFSLTIYLHRLFPGRIGPCLLISALSLAFLVLPYIIRSTQLALESIPLPLRLTAPALGADRWQNIRLILLPACMSRILGGIILAIGRAAEDTAVIMLTGVVASAGVPHSLFEQFEALPFYIYYISSQYTTVEELETGFAAALLLLAVCTLLFMLAYLVERMFLRHIRLN